MRIGQYPLLEVDRGVNYPILVSDNSFTGSLHSPAVGAGVELKALARQGEGDKKDVVPPLFPPKVPMADEVEPNGSSRASVGTSSKSTPGITGV